MSVSIRIQADEANRLKNDTAFQQFVQNVRDNQMQIFADSAASDIEAREEAHAIIRALKKIEIELDAAIAAQVIIDRKR
jgi:propanediol dehydratase large subunit